MFIGGLLIRWGAHAMHDAQVRAGPVHLLDASLSKVAACGFYLALRPDGFVLHMSASAAHVSEMRERAFTRVNEASVGEETADAARLVASELVGNVVRICGPFTPVVVRVGGLPDEVWVDVHDPEPSVLPHRRQVPPDNGEFESGRGLWILDVLAPGWTVEPTELGKRVRCRVLLAGRKGA